MIEATLGKLAAGEDLSREEMRAAVGAIMEGKCSEGEIATLLTALAQKGETVEELAGAASAMREHMTPIRSQRHGILDTCGTGGTGSQTFNISTAAGLVAAAAGVPVAKHGNRSVTSRTGSADVLEALGVKLEVPTARVEACLDELGFCFCYARSCHPAMRYVAPVRQKLGMRTIFNLLGPLSNPAGAPFQLLGTGSRALREKLGRALLLLGTQRSVLITGKGGWGEIAPHGETEVTVAENGQLSHFTWLPTDFGLPEVPVEALFVANPTESAAVIRSVLAGDPGPAREVVLLNAAAALWTAGVDASPAACAQLAGETIDRGAADALLHQLIERTNQ